jgi:hypothetical protein
MTHFVLSIGAVVVAAAMAHADAETPAIDQRQANQEQRIDQGIAKGQLNQREAERLNKRQERINGMEDKAKSDGIMTKKERARLHAAQNRASKNIHREKHDRQKSGRP